MKRLLLPLLACTSSLGFATEFTVNSTMDMVDINPGDGICQAENDLCTLRAAVMEANETEALDTIVLPQGDYVLGLAGLDEDESASGDLDILHPLTITAAGSEVSTIGGAKQHRLFHVSSTASLALSGVTLNEGSADIGSAIYNQGSVELSNCIVANNIFSKTASIFGTDSSNISINNCHFDSNEQVDQASGYNYYASAIELREKTEARITNTTFSSTLAANGSYVIKLGDFSTVIGTQLNFSNYQVRGLISATDGQYNNNLTFSTISLSNVKANDTSASEGLFRASTVELDGADISNVNGLVIRASSAFLSNSNIANVTNTGTNAKGFGEQRTAGVYARSVTVENSTFTNLSSKNCAVIDASGNQARIVNSTFIGNESTERFGVVCVNSGSYLSNNEFSGNNAIEGIIHSGNAKDSNATSIIFSNQFFNNQVSGNGGAVHISAATRVENSLFINNTAAGSGQAIYVSDGSHEVDSSTLFSSTNSGALAAVDTANNASLSFKNSVIESQGTACSSGLSSAGFNAVSDPESCDKFSETLGDKIADSAMQIWNATDNTITATTDSALLDSGSKLSCQKFRVDALGNVRADIEACDRGAIEFGGETANQGIIAFAEPEFHLIENSDATGELVLQRIGGSDGTVTFNINDIDATVREHTSSRFYFYNFPDNQTITWEHGDNSNKIIEVAVRGDADRKYSQQYVTFKISDIKGGATILPSASTTNLVIEDDERAIGRVTWSAVPDTSYVDESAGIAKLKLERKDGRDGEVSVKYRTLDDTALAGADYEAVQGTLTWKDLEFDAKFIEIPIIDNDYYDSNQPKFKVEFYDETGGLQIGYTKTFTFTIEDNEPEPASPGTIAITETSLSWFESEPSKQVMVARTGGFDAQQLVSWRLVGDNLEDDFLVTKGTLVFSGNESEKVINLEVIDDAIYENDENFDIEIYSVKGGAYYSSADKNITIRNDDARPQPGTFSIRSTLYGFNEASGMASVVIERTGGSDGQVIVSIKAAPAMLPIALAGLDFEAPATELVFADGEVSKQIDIVLINDTETEQNELFEVSITNVESENAIVSAQIDSSGDSTTVMIIDDETNGVPTPNPFITPAVTPTVTSIATPDATPVATPVVTAVVVTTTSAPTSEPTPAPITTPAVTVTGEPSIAPTAAPQTDNNQQAGTSADKKSGSFGSILGFVLLAGLLTFRRRNLH